MASIQDFASESGTVRVASVIPTAAEYAGAESLGSVSYGLIKYTFNAVDLSPVIVGDVLNAAGFTNAENNAEGMVVSAISNVDNTITVRSTTRTDTNKDETGATGTGSVLATAAAKQKPTDNFITRGFKVPEKVSDAYWNWIIAELVAVVVSFAVYDDVAAWQAVNHSGIDGSLAVVRGFGLFRYDASSTLVADNETVLEPTAGGGRGIMELAHPNAIFAYSQALYGDPNYNVSIVFPLDFPSVGNDEELTVSVPGAMIDSEVTVTPPATLNSVLIPTAWVSAQDEVTIRLRNTTGGALNPPLGNFRITVRMY